MAGLHVPGYNIFRKDRVGNRGGGVIFYVREHLKCTQIEWVCVHNLECIGLKIALSPQMSITLIGMYRPPSASNAFYAELQALLKECDTKNEVILLGDLNINWLDKSNRRQLKSLLTNLNFTQLIKGPTRLTTSSETCIDLVFSNKCERIQKTFNMITGLSDHNLILFSRKLSKNRFSCTKKTTSEQMRVPRREIPNLTQTLNNINWDNYLTHNHVSDNCNVFMTVIQDTVSAFTRKIKAKPSKKNHLPWLNETICTLLKKRDHALKISLKTKRVNDRQTFTSLRNKVVKEIRFAKANFFINIISTARGNAKEIWTNIKKLTGNSIVHREIRELQLEEKVIHDPRDIATTLNDYFIDSVKELTQSNFPQIEYHPPMPLNADNPFLNLCIVSQSQVDKAVCGLKSSKAKDAFCMDVTFLKYHKESFIAPLTTIINNSINESSFPEPWKCSVITPVFKSGNPAIPSNYRPISILPAVSKVMEKIVAEQIEDHLNNSPYTLNRMQFGFRKHHSTETAVCFFLENIKSKLDGGGVIGAVFIDLRKAFDTINHQILLTKLSSFNFSQSTLNWIESYISSRSQCVRIQNMKSTLRNNNLGVPQGSVLGPLLFSLFINDLPSCCPSNVTCQMYADDTVLYVHAKDKKHAAQELTDAMTNVYNWLEKSQLYLNTSKTVCMYFSKRANTDSDTNVSVQGKTIEVVQEFKYLGITLDSQLLFKRQIKNTVNRIKFNLSNFRFIRNNLTLESAKLYFDTMIMSHMSYCVTSWASACKTRLKPIETVYKQALKVLDKKPKTYHHCQILKKHER